MRPSVCIVEELGATCEMNVQIEIDSLKGGTYCYYLDHKLLQCWSHDNPLKSLTLRFSKETVLLLKDHQQNTILQQKLEVKVRNKTIKARRVKQPWSLF